jgi:RNA polymerase sigma-70 factor (ECF subfamily)
VVQTDEQWVAAAVGGDERAYRALYERYQLAVQRVAQGFAELDVDEVKDVVQESFVRAFRALPRLRERNRFGPWLLTIARNRSLSHLAKRHLISRTLDEFEHGVEPEADGLAMKALDSGPELEAVRELIQSLPEGAEKETVRLFYLEGELSARMIAERLGVGKSAVTMRLERFRAKVKKALIAKVLTLRGEAPVAENPKKGSK